MNTSVGEGEIHNISETEDTQTYGSRIEWFEIPALAVDGIAILTNLLVIYIIISKKQLHTRLHLSILQWCLFDTLCISLGVPSMYLFKLIMENLQPELICFYIDALLILSTVCSLFTFILLIVWMIDSYCHRSGGFKNYIFDILLFMLPWLVLIILFSFSYISCIRGKSLSLLFNTSLLCYCSVLFITIIANMFACFKRCSRNGKNKNAYLALSIVSVIVISWLPQWCIIYLNHVYKNVIPTDAQMLISTSGYFSSLFVLLVLYRNDIEFRNSLKNMCNCFK